MNKSVEDFERRERGFFNSQLRADESGIWISKKGITLLPMSDEKRERRGFDLFNVKGSKGS